MTAPRRAPWFRFDVTDSFPRYCLIAWHLALIPSIVLVLLAHLVFTTAGADVDALRKPPTDIERRSFLIPLALAPLIETLVLAAGLHALSIVTRHRALIATLSALAWGALHASFHPMWFFGTVWSFYVFSRAYLAWRAVSYKHALGAAAVPHALVNASALLMQFFAKN
jgi:hypothetical protein